MYFKKGNFPHHANVPQNWNKVIPFPDVGMHTIEKKSSKEKQRLSEWHAAEKISCDGVLDFRLQTVDYCSNDVIILRKRALKFEDDFVSLTEIDPLRASLLPLRARNTSKHT